MYHTRSLPLWDNSPEAEKRVNAVSELKRLAEEADRDPSRRFTVKLDRDVLLGGRKLDKGTYSLALLNRKGNHGALYFFKGKTINPKKVAALTEVEISPAANDSEPLVIDGQGRTGQIRQVRLASESCHIL